MAEQHGQGMPMTAEAARSARVLLVGKRVRVLDELGRSLQHLGMEAIQETDLERARNSIDGSSVDVVALGRAVRGAKREALVSALRAQNPSLKVVDGLAPIPQLLVAQIQESLSTPSGDARIVNSAVYEQVNNRVVLMMQRSADVTVTMLRLDLMHRLHQMPIFVGRLGDGRQNIPIGRKIGRGERFLVVQADEQTSAHQVN
ncbi:hypothetical protein EF847_18760 [Actinobacteria bacterium YIM 96077]|uniref:Uncharacterized protein n=1 Tax=Phytoactinopolyspora halophila TaxID=1981511 RepID=A0A329QG56_9ACTN|nr:hypothetical protein [Phytoactinopolyspora halophila]AYY14430.1 hypothetical protein EF847_18760 [Actinobacteria bacterium YIM 96077]RAW11423.1 hypothetical protein DPM12_16410 [Phytoactinopolyspora halophila]